MGGVYEAYRGRGGRSGLRVGHLRGGRVECWRDAIVVAVLGSLRRYLAHRVGAITHIISYGVAFRLEVAVGVGSAVRGGVRGGEGVHMGHLSALRRAATYV